MKRTVHMIIPVWGLMALFFYPITTTAQLQWDKYEGNPVISEVPWIERAGSPVVIFEDNKFKMWFTAEDKIGYAESEDGIEWIINDEPVIPQAEPGAWDYKRGTGSIVRIGDTLKMWYSGTNDPNNWEWAIGYAWSTDNDTFHLHPDPVLEKGDPGSWDEVFVHNPTVHYDGQIYHMWYAGKENLLNAYWPTLIGYATSPDGINWTKYPENPVMDSLGPPGSFCDKWILGPRVLYNENIYHMWFVGWDGYSIQPFNYYRIGYASSDDGIDWEVQNDYQAVLDLGSTGEWDDSWVRNCCVIIHDNRYKMWYDGTMNGSFYNLKIGYAIGDTLPPNFIPESNSGFAIKLFPNPCSDVARIQLTLLKSENICIDMYDISGNRIRTVVDKMLLPGVSELEIDLSELPAGIYLLRLNTLDRIQTIKLIKTRSS